MRYKNGTAVVCVKTADLRIKEAGPDDGLAEGEFIGYASVFGNLDSYGDIVDETFFDNTLEQWKASGDTIPVLWGHDTMDPFNNIGGLKDAVAIKNDPAKDDSQEQPGLRVHGFLDIADNPVAAQVYRLMKGRRTTKMSFAYSVREEQKKDDGNHLMDGDLFEVSVVQIPANQEAEILTVKHALAPLMKAGRVLSTKNEESLRQARDAIDAVLNSLGTEGDGADDPTKASGKAPAKDEEPSGAKSEEPTPDPSVSERELKEIEDGLLAADFGLHLSRKD